MGATLRLRDTLPEDIVLLGIQPACLEIGRGLSPSVADALDHLVAAALAELEADQLPG